MKGGIKELSKNLGITISAVRKAMADGRIETYKKNGKAYVFDIDLATQEYELNTQQNLSSNKMFDDDQDDRTTGLREFDQESSVLDIDPKFWTANQAIQAKTIYSALKTKHELDVAKGKFYLKTEADSEFMRISTVFSRGLIQLPSKIRQRIPDLTDEQIKLIRELCNDISSECANKLDEK